MKIAVGSDNPVKLAAVTNVVKKVWPNVDCVAVAVKSGVTAQPTSEDEAIDGATNRARAALRAVAADMGFGLEGNTVDGKHGMFLEGWVAAVHADGRVGLGSSGRIPLPEIVAAQIRAGNELGPIMDKLTGGQDTKKKQGTAGILTNGLTNRTDGFERGVLYALARFLNDLYENKPKS